MKNYIKKIEEIGRKLKNSFKKFYERAFTDNLEFRYLGGELVKRIGDHEKIMPPIKKQSRKPKKPFFVRKVYKVSIKTNENKYRVRAYESIFNLNNKIKDPNDKYLAFEQVAFFKNGKEIVEPKTESIIVIDTKQKRGEEPIKIPRLKPDKEKDLEKILHDAKITQIH